MSGPTVKVVSAGHGMALSQAVAALAAAGMMAVGISPDHMDRPDRPVRRAVKKSRDVQHFTSQKPLTKRQRRRQRGKRSTTS